MLVYFCYLLIVIVSLRHEIGKTFNETVLKATLIFGTLVVLITEGLSLFQSINPVSLYLVWGLISGILLFFIVSKRNETARQFNEKRTLWIASYKSLEWYEKTLIWIMPFLVLPLLYQGIIYPPNNWDSLTYHMSRIMYWIGNESVAHFPVRIFRLLYQPPFAEFMIMNINLINGNDYLSNSVQLFFLVMSTFGVYAILDALNVPRFYKILGAFLVLTISSTELQATTAKNDIVCGFFLLASIYFCIQFYIRNITRDFIFLGISVGLAMLTKGTAYVYLTPLLGILAIVIVLKIIITKDFCPIYKGFGAIIIIILLNAGHFIRNYKVNGSFISVENVETQTISNDQMNAKFFVSNLMKNAGLHLAYPVDRIADKTIRKIHTEMGVSIDDPRLNFQQYKYEGARFKTTHEDYVPNPIQFLLLNISFLVLICRFRSLQKNKRFLILAAVIVLQVLLFSLILKWQPWHTRLHIPIFLFSAVIISATAFLSKWFKYFVICCIPFLLYNFVYYLAYNELRPIIWNPELTRNIKLSDNRLKKYFTNQPILYSEYSKVVNTMYATNNLQKIGLIMDDWEYPLLHDLYYDHVKILAINTSNPTSKIPQDIKNIDVIVSDTFNAPYIDFEGKRYMNATPNHNHLWIYK